MFFCRSLVVPFSFSLVVVAAAVLDLLGSVGSEPDLAGAGGSGAFVSVACDSAFLFVLVAPAVAPQLAFIDVVPSAFAGVVQTVVSASAAKARIDAHKIGDCFISSSCMWGGRYRRWSNTQSDDYIANNITLRTQRSDSIPTRGLSV